MRRFIIIAVNKKTYERRFLAGVCDFDYHWVEKEEDANIYEDYYVAYHDWHRGTIATDIDVKKWRVLIPNYPLG